MGNLRHSHLAPYNLLAAEAEPVATTASSAKLHKETDNVSHRSESGVAPDLPSSSAPRNHDNVSLRSESEVAPVPVQTSNSTIITSENASKEHPSLKDEGSNQSSKLKTKPEVANSSSLVGDNENRMSTAAKPLNQSQSNFLAHAVNYSLIESRLDQSLYGNREWELTHRNDTDDGRPLPHFFMHIPKTGGYYAYTWLNSMLWQKHSPIFKLPTEDKFRLCNMGSGRLKQRKESHKGKKDLVPIRCNMWMTEREYNEDAANTYTVIRDPREHVLSQYFHCKESKHSKEDRLRRIGSLTDWLEKWVDTLEGGKVDDMNCYDPRNKQSQFTNYGNPARALSPNDALSDIQRRFTVIGPMDEMDKVLCVTFLHYTGWLPPQCDCTSKTTTTAFDEGKEKEDAAASAAARSTIQKKEKTKEAHGVKHHAKTFNASSYQNILIDKLTEKDVMLYEGVKHLFNEQVRVVESRLNVNICNEFNL